MSKKARKAQKLVMEEIKKQLLLQAERWDRGDHYNPIALEEMERDQCYRILGDLYAEKSNLEYEMHILGTDKHETLIKIERLDVYIKKALQVIERHDRFIFRILRKDIGDESQIRRALPWKRNISVLLSEN